MSIVVNAYIPNIYVVKAKGSSQDQSKPEMESMEKEMGGKLGRRRQGGSEGDSE